MKSKCISLFITIALAASGPTSAGMLSSAAARSAANAATKRSAVQTAVIAGKKPHDVVIKRSQHPESAAHIEHAQKHGQPTILTLDKARANKRRQESMRNIQRKEWTSPTKDRDEYPFAMTREGGANASVRYLDASDNRGAGSSIRHQLRGLPEGTRFRVSVSE